MPETEWRYFVIAFQGNNATIVELQQAFDLISTELEIAFTRLHRNDDRGRMHIYHPDRLFQFLKEVEHHAVVKDDSLFVEVGGDQVNEITATHALLRERGPEFPEHKMLVSQLSALKGLPYRSSLRLLGYFALLESLITHAPKPTDPYDSITRQIQKKLNLIDHRLPRPIDYSPFGNVSPDTVWSKMYACRSTVAHGGTPHFAKGELRLLKSLDQVLKLVRDTTKAVIIQALREPQLLRDLREC